MNLTLVKQIPFTRPLYPLHLHRNRRIIDLLLAFAVSLPQSMFHWMQHHSNGVRYQNTA